MRPLDWLPRIPALAALLVWGITLFITVNSGAKLSSPFILFALVAMGVATLVLLFPQNPDAGFSAARLWLSAGLWGGASYLNPESIGFLYLLVSVVTAVSATLVERARGGFSLTGPAIFIGAMVLTIVIGNALAA